MAIAASPDQEKSTRLYRRSVPRVRFSLRTLLVGIAVAALTCRLWSPLAYQFKRVVGNLQGRGHYGPCQRCGDRNNWKTFHLTTVDDSDEYLPEGLGSLCQDCWSALSPVQRLPYYLAHVAWLEQEDGPDYFQNAHLAPDHSGRLLTSRYKSWDEFRHAVTAAVLAEEAGDTIGPFAP